MISGYVLSERSCLPRDSCFLVYASFLGYQEAGKEEEMRLIILASPNNSRQDRALAWLYKHINDPYGLFGLSQNTTVLTERFVAVKKSQMPAELLGKFIVWYADNKQGACLLLDQGNHEGFSPWRIIRKS